jgi:hypothetical protein
MGRVFRLEAKTDFVSQVGKINGKLIEGINSVNARAASGSALVLDPLAHSLKLVFQCCLVDGELDWAPAIFAFYAMLQAVEAHDPTRPGERRGSASVALNICKKGRQASAVSCRRGPSLFYIIF